MGFFGSSKKEEEKKQPVQQKKEVVQPKPAAPKVSTSVDMIKTPTHNLSIIKENISIQATMKGKGSLVIGGDFEGDIKIDDTLFIEKGARCEGSVHARNVKVSGEFSGNIFATAVEVTKSGKLNGNINANKTSLGGDVKGSIRSIDTLEVTRTGRVDTKEAKSKKIKIEGKVNGRVVASELLEVVSTGAIEGDIITKGIRTEQGGSIVGNIQTYDEKIHNNNSTLEKTSQPKEEKDLDIDPEIAKLINIKPDDMKKYAKKEESPIKRIPEDKK